MKVAAGSWVETGFAEHDLDMLQDIRSDTDQVAKAVLAASIGTAYRLLDSRGRCFVGKQD